MNIHVLDYFSKKEKLLWCFSIAAIPVFFPLFDRKSSLTLAASMVGVTSLIFNAKGNPFGQLLMILFSMLCGVISFTFSYYSEMIIYLGMTAPMALFALISWLRNPFEGRRAEVKANRITRKEHLFMWGLTALVTGIFYLILRRFGTTNLLPSTLSVTTAFAAVYLMFRRSPYFTIVCFLALLMNDIYGFISWRQMEKRQAQTCA